MAGGVRYVMDVHLYYLAPVAGRVSKKPPTLAFRLVHAAHLNIVNTHTA